MVRLNDFSIYKIGVIKEEKGKNGREVIDEEIINEDEN